MDAGSSGRKAPRRWIGWGGAAALLLAPLGAMQVSDEVNWSLFDFVFMGALFGAVGFGLELAVARSRSGAYRLAAGVALAAAFLLVWINAAVGVIGNEQADANRLFVGVVAIGLLGAIAAQGRPARMARAMGAAALAQLLVPMIAWAGFPASRAAILSPEVVILTGVFAALWLVAGALFRRAAQDERSS